MTTIVGKRQERLRHWLSLGLFGWAVALLLITLLSHRYLYDFGSFLASGRAAANGLDPYGVYELTNIFEVGGRRIVAPNLNPPLSVPLFQALSALDPALAFRLWYGFSFVLYLATLWLLRRAYPAQATRLRLLWALALWGFWHTLIVGQLYVLLAFFVTGAWLLLRRDRLIAAGVLVGLLVSLKPNFLVWPALLLLAGGWPVTLAALASAALLSALPLLIYGPEVYARWLAVLSADQLVSHAENASLPGLAAQLRQPAAGPLLAVALLLAAAALVYHYRPPILATSALALTVSVLASPVAWEGYVLFLLPVFFDGCWNRLYTAAALLLLLPLVIYGPIHSIALLLVLAAAVGRCWREARQAPGAASVQAASGRT